MSYKILFLGGTRFFGKEIAKFLTREGHEVTLFTRGINPTPLNIDHFKGDRNQEEDIKKVSQLKNWDVVIDNICFQPEEMALSLKHFKKLKRYLFTSTISVYRYSKKPVDTVYKESEVDFNWKPPEEDLEDPHWQYAHGKKEAEKKLIEAKQFPFTIFRLSMVYGPNDPAKRIEWYLEKLKKGETIPIAGNGNYPFQFTYSKDLPSIYSECVKNSKTENKIYNVAAPGTITLGQILHKKSKELQISLKTRRDETQKDSIHGPLSYQREWLLNTENFQSTFSTPLTPLKNFI